jgi:hypothetical protein
VKADLTAGVKVWTEDELLFAFGSGIFKPVTDTETVIEANNVDTAGNLTIDANKNIGKVADALVITLGATPASLTEDERVAIASAERQDIVFAKKVEQGLAVSFGNNALGKGTITRLRARGPATASTTTSMLAARPPTPPPRAATTRSLRSTARRSPWWAKRLPGSRRPSRSLASRPTGPLPSPTRCSIRSRRPVASSPMSSSRSVTTSMWRSMA